MTGKVLWLVLLCAVAGTHGCMKGRKTTTESPRITTELPRITTELPETTTVPPTATSEPAAVEPVIQAVTAPANVGRAAGGSRPKGSRGSGRNKSGGSRSTSTVSNTELSQLSEELLTLDPGITQPTLRQQGRTSPKATRDSALNPLIESVNSSIFNKDTVRLMKQLLDNYDPDVSNPEVKTSTEQTEETRFLDALMETPLMQRLERFLKEKNLISRGLRATLEEIWFTLYGRKGRHLGTSGFEHVFVGELKGGKVSGFHNWLSFRKEEVDGDLNYMGYMKIVDLKGKGKIIKLRFDWLHKPKPVGSIFVGTTPELEIGLYTMCFLVKPNSNCRIKLAGNKLGIQTWTSTISGKTVVGSAYPNI